jgi:hypothetical protein
VSTGVGIGVSAIGMVVGICSTMGGGGGALIGVGSFEPDVTGVAVGIGSAVGGGGGDAIPGGINGSTASFGGVRLSWGFDPGGV